MILYILWCYFGNLRSWISLQSLHAIYTRTKFYLFLQYIFERCKFSDSCFTLYEMFTEETINVHLQSYVTASTPVIAYLDKLFLSKNLGIDWWRDWKLKKTRMGLVILQVLSLFKVSLLSIYACNDITASKSWIISWTALVMSEKNSNKPSLYQRYVYEVRVLLELFSKMNCYMYLFFFVSSSTFHLPNGGLHDF